VKNESQVYKTKLAGSSTSANQRGPQDPDSARHSA